MGRVYETEYTDWEDGRIRCCITYRNWWKVFGYGNTREEAFANAEKEVIDLEEELRGREVEPDGNS